MFNSSSNWVVKLFYEKICVIENFWIMHGVGKKKTDKKKYIPDLYHNTIICNKLRHLSQKTVSKKQSLMSCESKISVRLHNSLHYSN
jgi:hypothetical protein